MGMQYIIDCKFATHKSTLFSYFVLAILYFCLSVVVACLVFQHI
jgi:hypothetical protein